MMNTNENWAIIEKNLRMLKLSTFTKTEKHNLKVRIF